MELFNYFCILFQVNFIFTKKTGALWKSFGTRTTEFKEKLKERLYREYEVVSNTLLCKVVHLMVLRAKDYLELVPIGRHLEAKKSVLGRFSFLFLRKHIFHLRMISIY